MDYTLFFARRQNVITWSLSHGITDPLCFLIITGFIPTIPPTHTYRPCGVQPQASYYRILCWLTIYSQAMKEKNWRSPIPNFRKVVNYVYLKSIRKILEETYTKQASCERDDSWWIRRERRASSFQFLPHKLFLKTGVQSKDIDSSIKKPVSVFTKHSSSVYPRKQLSTSASRAYV
jgi:hypothetical protein